MKIKWWLIGKDIKNVGVSIKDFFKKYIKDENEVELRCQECGSRDMTSSGFGTTTLMGWSGGPDPNISTQGYACDKCGTGHRVTSQYGKIQSIEKTETLLG